MVNPPQVPGPGSASKPNGCLIAALALVGLVVLVNLGKCSPNDGTANSSSAIDTNQFSDTVSNAVAAQDAPPVQPLSPGSVRRGIGHFRSALKAEGLSGAMIYSQNCYDSLARAFTWAKLDQCGAFDMMAANAVPESDTTGLLKEADYFASEAVATRYLGAATGAGEEASDADQRLSAVQNRVPKPAATAASPPAAPPEAAQSDSEPLPAEPDTDPANAEDAE